MDPIVSVAEHIVKTRFEDLPKDVVEKVKLFILDSLGVALPGSGAPGVPQVSGLMAELGGKPEASVFVFGHKLTMMDAAMVNSMMVHAMDLDDLHEDSIVHPSCCQVPTAFAVAEPRSPVNGKDLITAIALGFDISWYYFRHRIYQIGDLRNLRRRCQCSQASQLLKRDNHQRHGDSPEPHSGECSSSFGWFIGKKDTARLYGPGWYFFRTAG
jgi:hypothetical protein